MPKRRGNGIWIAPESRAAFAKAADEARKLQDKQKALRKTVLRRLEEIDSNIAKFQGIIDLAGGRRQAKESRRLAPAKDPSRVIYPPLPKEAQEKITAVLKSATEPFKTAAIQAAILNSNGKPIYTVATVSSYLKRGVVNGTFRRVDKATWALPESPR